MFHSSLSNVEVKNEWSCTSTPPVYLHGMYGDSCNGTFVLNVIFGRRKLLRTCWLHRLTSLATLFVSDTLFWGAWRPIV